MKIEVGPEEYWIVVLNGRGLGPGQAIVDLPRSVVRRCKRAEKEFFNCVDILEEAYRKAKGET